MVRGSCAQWIWAALAVVLAFAIQSRCAAHICQVLVPPGPLWQRCTPLQPTPRHRAPSRRCLASFRPNCKSLPRTPCAADPGIADVSSAGPGIAELVQFAVGAGLILWAVAGAVQSWQQREQRAAYEAQEAAAIAAMAKRAYIARREEPWTEEELSAFDGSQDPDGPILIAVDGIVLNVWKGRQFYLPGCEYHIFAGRDATRLLARGILEEETPEEAMLPLNLGEQASLQTWKFTLTSKYEAVGTLGPSERERSSKEESSSGDRGPRS